MNLGPGKKRREAAVRFSYGMLGLDYGKGHLDNLYRAAYIDGFRDALALMRAQAEEWDDGHYAAIMKAEKLRP